MKNFTIFWSVLPVVFNALVIEHIRAFAATPFEFKPNWLTIIPATAICVALVGLLIRKEFAAAGSRSPAAEGELAAVRAGAPLADLASLSVADLPRGI